MRSDSISVNDESGGILNRTWSIFKYYPGSCVEGLGKTTKNLKLDKWSLTGVRNENLLVIIQVPYSRDNLFGQTP